MYFRILRRTCREYATLSTARTANFYHLPLSPPLVLLLRDLTEAIFLPLIFSLFHSPLHLPPRTLNQSALCGSMYTFRLERNSNWQSIPCSSFSFRSPGPIAPREESIAMIIRYIRRFSEPYMLGILSLGTNSWACFSSRITQKGVVYCGDVGLLLQVREYTASWRCR